MVLLLTEHLAVRMTCHDFGDPDRTVMTTKDPDLSFFAASAR